MKYFLEMIEEINNRKVFGITSTTESKPLNDSDYSYLLESLKICHPFVFFRKGETIDLDTNPKGSYVKLEDGVEFDAPFNCFSVELVDGLISAHSETDALKTDIKCIMAVELAPKDFMYTWLAYSHRFKANYVLCGREYRFYQMIKHFVERINSEKIGTESVSKKIKIGSGKLKSFHKYKLLTYVYPKSLFKQGVQNQQEFANKKIDWSHRWFSRGHWRHINHSSLGKDRNGVYKIAGNTWVTECTKGPESAPLIKKVHVVKDDHTNNINN